MLITIGFYIAVGIIGLFGLALIVASIASLIHNTCRNNRIKKYTKEKQVVKETEKQHNQENTKYIVNNGRPVVITQSGYDDQRVTIGYVPNGSMLRVSQTVQANAGNRGEKTVATKERNQKNIKNSTRVMSKVSRNNDHNAKHGACIPKWKVKNYNEHSKYNEYNKKHISRQK